MVTISKITRPGGAATVSSLTKDYSAYTSSQIAALSTATIAALSTTELATFKKAQIAALTTAQIAAFGASQIGFLATDQVAAFTTASLAALDTKQAAALTSSQIGVLTGAQFAALSGPDIAAFDTSEIAALSSVQITALNTSQISSLTTDQIAALTSAQSTKLTSVQVGALSQKQIVALSNAVLSNLSQTALGGLTTNQISAFGTEQIAALLTGQIANLSTLQISALGNDQIVALTTGQVAALRGSQIAALSTGQIAGMENADFAILNSTQIASLTTAQIRALTSDEIKLLSSGQIAGLTTAQINALSTSQINQFSTSQLQALTSTQLPSLGTSQIAALTTNQIAAFQPASLSKLTAQQVAAMGTEDIAALSNAQVGALTSNQIAALSTDQITALSTSQFSALTSIQISALKNGQIAAISTDQIAALSAANLSKFSTQQITALETTDVAALSKEQLLALTALQVAAMTTSQITAFTTSQIGSLASTQIAALKTIQISAINTAQVVALTTAQVSALNAAQVAALSTDQIVAMETADFAAFSGTQLGAIGTTQIQALRTDEITALAASKIKMLSTSQIAALSNSAVSALSTTQLTNLSGAQIGSFKVSQLPAISTDQFVSLTAIQMAALNTDQMAALTTGQVNSLSLTKVAALTSLQLGAITTQNIRTLVTAQIAALKPTQMSSLGTDQISALSSDQVSSLSSAQIAALTTGQIGALTTDQIIALNTKQIAALSASQVTAMSTGQIASLETVDFAALNTIQLSSLSTAQVQALTTAEIAALSSAKISGLTSAQISALETTDVRALSASQLGGLTTTQLSALTAPQVEQIYTAEKASALKLPQTMSGAITGLAITDTLANVLAKADQLLALSKNKQLSGITLSDPPTLPRSMTSADAKKYAPLLDLIQNDKIAVTSVKTSDVAAFSTLKNIKALSIEDTAANILQAKTSIAEVNKTLKIAKVTATDAVTFDQATSITDLREVNGISVALKEIRDTAENVASHLRFDYRNLITAPGKVSVLNTTTPAISIADATLLKSISFIDQNFKYNIVDSADAIAAQSAKASEKILANAGQVSVATKYSVSQLKLALQYNSVDPNTKIILEDNVQNILAEGQKTGGGLLAKAALVNVADTIGNVTSQLSSLETLAGAKRLSQVAFTDNQQLPDLRLTNDQISQSVLTLGKIKDVYSISPVQTSADTVKAISATRNITDSDLYAYLMSPSAATFGGDQMWGIGKINPDTFTLNGVNKYQVTLAPQDRLDAEPVNQGQSLDIAEAYTSYKKNAVTPFLFSRATNSPYTLGGVLWLDLGDPANTTHSVKFSNIKFTNYDYSGTATGYFPGKIQTYDGSKKTILSGLNIGENFRTNYSSTGFNFAWETAADSDGKFELNLANFDTTGTQIGQVIKVGQYAAGTDWNINNDPDGNIEIQISDNSSITLKKYGVGSTPVNTAHYPAMTIQLPSAFDAGGVGRVFSSYTNNNNNISYAVSGTRDGQSVVDFFSYDLAKKELVSLKTLIMSGKTPVSKMNSYRTSPTGDMIWAYQDNTNMHLTRVDKTGLVTSDFVKPIPGAAIFENQFAARAFSTIRNFNDGRFEMVWRQAALGSNNTPVQYQLFDTRTAGAALAGSSTYMSLLGGTPYADTITTNYSGSIVEGGAGADQLTANVTNWYSNLNPPTLSYAHSPAGVTVNLTAKTASGGDAEGDTISGSFYNIIGSQFADNLTGTASAALNAPYSNIFKGNGGDDKLIGGGGNDLAVYNGDAENYRIKINADATVTVQDMRDGSPDGTDTLTGITNIQFWDRLITLKT